MTLNKITKTIYNVYIIIRFNRRLNTRTAPSLYYIIRIREKRSD